MSDPIDVTDRLNRAFRLAAFAIDANANVLQPDHVQVHQQEFASISHDDQSNDDAAQRALAAKAAADQVRAPVQHDMPDAPDAVLNSVQSALHAVQASLEDPSNVSTDALPSANMSVGPEALSDQASNVSPLGSSAATVSLGAASLPLGAAGAQSDSLSLDSGMSPIVSPEAALQPAVQTVAQTVGAVTGIAGGVVETVGGVLDGIPIINGIPVLDGVPIINGIPVLDGIPGLAGIPGIGPVIGAVDGVENAVTDIASSAVNGLGAVTIPSLEGLGFDALTGLLPVSSTVESEVAAPTAINVLDDLIGLSAIGVPEVFDVAHSAAHDTHSPLQLVGSGLL